MDEVLDLDLKYRPKTLDEVVGQEAAVRAIRAFKGNVPRAVLLHGGSGVGKTTLARIIARDLGAEDGSMDFKEVNCGGLESPITWVRDLMRQTTAAAMRAGGRRVWILDEAQTLSRQKGSQEALLKVLEDSPPHNVFFLCTTEPKRLLPAVRGRCVEIGLRSLKSEEIEALVGRIAFAEKVPVTAKVVARIVENADGGARAAVKCLQKVMGLSDPVEQLAALGGFGDDAEAFKLAKVVLYEPSPSWDKVRVVLSELDDHEAEGLRCMVVCAAKTSMLKGGNVHRYYKTISCLKEPIYATGAVGKALLCIALYEAVSTK